MSHAAKIALPNDLARPALVALGQTIEQPDRVVAWLRRFSQHPLTVLLKNEGGKIFTDQGGGVGFIDLGSSVLAIGGIGGILPDGQAATDLLASFLEWCNAQGKTARFVHFSRAEGAILEGLGYRIEQLGASYQLDFANVGLAGSQYRQVRRKISHAERAGIAIEEVTERNRFNEVRPALEEINSDWQRAKHAKPLRHMVYDFGLVEPTPDERVFVAWHGGRIVSYLVFSRVLREGERVWFHNLSRRRADCVDGTMQAIVAKFIEICGSGSLYLGFTPLVEMRDPEFRHSKLFNAIAMWLSRRGGLVYPARAQRQYKVSWAPQIIIPEYFAYKENTLSAALALLRSTNSI